MQAIEIVNRVNAQILQDFGCKFPDAKDKFVALFDAKIIPETMKMAGTSRSDYIRSLAILPAERSCGKFYLQCM